MVNSGGWLLLSVIFASLIMLVQRSEKKRRNVSLVVLLFVWSTVWGYGIYRIQRECDRSFPFTCNTIFMSDKFNQVAWNTTNTAALTALIFNGLFWFLIGRYNPPKSSDAITVIGLKDAPLPAFDLVEQSTQSPISTPSAAQEGRESKA